MFCQFTGRLNINTYTYKNKNFINYVRGPRFFSSDTDAAAGATAGAAAAASAAAIDATTTFVVVKTVVKTKAAAEAAVAAAPAATPAAASVSEENFFWTLIIYLFCFC